MSNSVIVKFTKRGSALAVKDAAAANAVDTQFHSKRAGKFVKKLMDESAKFKAVTSKLNEAYNWHKAVTMPFLDNGMRMLHVDKMDDYILQTNKYKSEIQRLLLDLKPEWDNEIALDMQRLAGLGNVKDYPSWGEIEYKYSIDVKFLPVPEASDFRFQVDQDIVNELDNMKKQAKIEGRQEVFARVEKVVGVAIDQCTKSNPRIFDSMLGNMADLADVMKYLNIHDDPEMTVVAEKLKELSESCTTFNLRNDEVIRKVLASDCEAFISKLRNGNWYEIQEPEVVEVEVQACQQNALADSLV